MVLKKLNMYHSSGKGLNPVQAELLLRTLWGEKGFAWFMIFLFVFVFHIVEWTGDEPKKKKHRTKKKKSAKKRGQNAVEGTGARSTDEKPQSERTEMEGNESDGSDEAYNDDMDDE